MFNVIYRETRHILKFEDDIDGTEKAWVKLDYSSGGYPSGVANVLNAHNFKSPEAALKYAAMFTKYPLKIKQEVFEIIVTVTI